MALHVLAVGNRMPKWVQNGVDEYTKRMPSNYTITWQEIRPESRGASTTPATCMRKEADRIRRALPRQSWLVILDETGKRQTTRGLADRLTAWQETGRPVSLVIGGPDGIDPPLKAEADETIRLSDLTLPHPLVRVVLAEQLYRAWSVIENHPYHRA